MLYILLRSAQASAAAQFAAWLAALALTIVSLVPGAFRPQLGLPGPLEHAIAYALTGIAFATAYPGIGRTRMAFLGLSAASGLFELLQNVIPGRSPAVLDVVASSSGAATGLIIGALVMSAASRSLRPSVAEQLRKSAARGDGS